ncbi:MAG: hypothetical protein A3H70_01280 [Candidatus Komeilibacteria bacterium RIFCSPLOWO2_02_FULL_48_11]|uniref:Ribbon-helix-helix protein CopG domain-containing protein n=1 Tax=Candidatus Komeilibacteria bacterium RIFCSPLOWO2_02_FULL_48_11 TaxID=1798553 RepID=A0A1G2BQR2_9BACT|nr:MAG: hypothetical protein A3H70_01280 [Candidatus Komeilibacteria bacterium RIFCSPLOWO2_02_FULL_48_11]
MPTTFITTNVRLPIILHKALKRRALEEDKSLAELIRNTLNVHYTHADSAQRKKIGIMVDGKKITTFSDLEKLAGPLGGDLSSNIDAIVYGEHSN